MSVEQLRLAMRELGRSYSELNRLHFRNGLIPAVLRLGVGATRLGRWDPSARCIEISESLLQTQPWPVVLEVLKHEMAHQYTWEVLKVRDEDPHGPAFRGVCERLGIDPRSSGLPPGPGENTNAVLDRVRKLLALAQSPNLHEAEAATMAARRLMLKYNLEHVPGEGDEAYSVRHLGVPAGRVPESDRLLAAILAEHFFVEVIWIPVFRPQDGKRASVLEVCGRPHNVEMASYVHAFLQATSERLWCEHKKARDIRLNRDRRHFLSGVMLGFLDKLRGEKKAAAGEGLVWLGEERLQSFLRKRHPRIEHVRYGGSGTSHARHQGRAAGRGIVLHRPVGGTAVDRGKLLIGGA